MNPVGTCTVCDEPVYADQSHRSFVLHGVPVTYHLICLFASRDTDFVPKGAQVSRYEEHWDEVVRGLRKALDDPVYVRHIHDLGLKRLKEGFHLYRDEMYRWHSSVREANMDEELADYVVYGTSA